MYKIGKILFFLILIAITLIVGVIAIAQTKWFKKELETSLQELGEKNGFCVSIGSIEGSLPLQWKISQVVLHKKDKLTLSVEEVKIRLAFIPLLRKHLVVSYLKTADAQLTLQTPTGQLSSKIQVESPPGRTLHNADFSEKKESFNEISNSSESTYAGSYIESERETKDRKRDCFNEGAQLSRGLHEVFASLSSLPFDLSLRSFHIDRFTIANASVLEEWSARGTFLIKKRASKIAINIHLDDLQRGNKFEVAVTGGRSRGQLEITQATLHSSLANIEAHGKISEEGELTEANAAIEIPELNKLSSQLQGKATLQTTLVGEDFQIECTSNNLLIEPLQIAYSRINLSAKRSGQEWRGLIEGTAENRQLATSITASLRASYTYHPAIKAINIEAIDLRAPTFFTGGHLNLKFTPFSINGNLQIQGNNLHTLQPFFTHRQLAGQCGGSIHFPDTNSPEAIVHLLANDLQWGDAVIGRATIYAEIADPLDHPQGKIEIEAERVYLTETYFSSLSLTSTSDHQGWPLTLQAEGTWKYPFSLQACLRYQNMAQKKILDFEKVDGFFFEQPVHLDKPLHLAWGNEHLYAKALACKIGEGFLEGDLDKSNTQLTLALKGEKLPLSWLAMFTPYLTLEGQSSLNCQVTANEESIRGNCRLDITRLQAQKRGEEAPLYAKGTIEAHIDSATLQIHSLLQASEEQLMLAQLSLPLCYNPKLFSLHIDQERALSGSFEIEGKLGEIFNYANTGSQEVSGWIAGKILAFGSLKKPQLQGSFKLEQASYNNHFVGLGIHGIQATIRAENDKLIIEEISAKDTNNGNLHGQGEVLLNMEKHFPYRLTGQFEHFDAVNLDLVQAKLTGPVTFEGNLKGARLEGAFTVNAAEISIPKSLPTNLPDLPFTFSEEPALGQGLPPPTRRVFPFAFDVSFEANDTLAFEGNGLTSVWGGHLHLHGINLKLLASGALRLSKGQFQILGKTFLLQQGELTFSDKPGQDGFLNLTGTLSVQDATITAQLRGPLSSPQLFFYATPALTTNEIFSLLLFNKRVSEIKPIQAVQLAHTVLTFYGHTGWNPVSQIGSGLNTLGIDTFDIIPSEDGLKQSSITIGKHFSLLRNMLVTLTQSRDSRRFMVEVDLGKGLLFQAENQSGAEQSQQEGKFSLKWNKNY